MPIPSKWWVHLIPGSIVVGSIYIWYGDYKVLFTLAPEEKSIQLLSSAIFASLSYVAGYLVNLIGVEAFKVGRWVFRRPEAYRHPPGIIMRFEHYASPTLVKLLYDGYDRLVFNRSLLASFVGLLIVSVARIPIGLYHAGIVVSIVVLWVAWRVQVEQHRSHMDQLESLVEELTNEETVPVGFART